MRVLGRTYGEIVRDVVPRLLGMVLGSEIALGPCLMLV